MRTQATFRIDLAMSAGAVIAGCANGVASPASTSSDLTPLSPAASLSPAAPAESTGSPVPSASGGGSSSDPDPLPTITKTAKPPREPSDPNPSTGWVTGMVTIGGKGPCYGLIADDGQRYALYSAEGLELAKGDRVNVHLKTTPLKIYCGPGSLMAMTDAEAIK